MRFEFGLMMSPYGFVMCLIWFRWWFRYGLNLVWERSAFSGFAVSWLQTRRENSPGTGFWSISRGFLWFWYDLIWFDMMLIWFWYSFDAILSKFDVILICFWYVFKILSSYFQSTFDPHQNHNFDPYQNHKWNQIKIIIAKPGQKQNTTNHIWIISKYKRTYFEKSPS